MNEEEFQDYLKNRYGNQIEWYDKKAIWNQKWYRRLQFSIIGFSALAPILVAVSVGWERWLAVFMTAFVAIAVSILKAFKYQENWINYRTTCETLKKEIHYYNAGIVPYDYTDEKEVVFVERVESLLSRENTIWLVTQQKREIDKEQI